VTTDGDSGGTPGAVAVHRAASVLRCFAGEEAELRLSDIARRTGLSPSTTHRLLTALVESGLLARDEGTDRYGLGPVLALIGARAARDAGLHRAVGVLHGLTSATGESATLAVRSGDAALVIATSSSPHRLRFDHAAGTRLPLHASAMGKVLLACGTGDLADAVAALGPLERYTAATLTDRRRLVAQLRTVRERRWAVNREERYDGVVGLAAPVLGAAGVAVAALGVQGPSTRLDPYRDTRVLDAVRAAATSLDGFIDSALGAPVT
jgi:IclR family acetate operon transcriptional repressor